MKKEVLIRGVDSDLYRRAKARAALSGETMGSALNEALKSWVDGSGLEGETNYRAEKARAEFVKNLRFVKSNWRQLAKQRGKAIVVSAGKLQGIFGTYQEARTFSSRFNVALAFVVDEGKAPADGEIEIGPELEIQPKQDA